MFCWKKGRKTIKKKFFLVLVPTSQDKWDWSDWETEIFSPSARDPDGNNTEICPIPRPGLVVLTLAAANFFTALGWENLFFINWSSGSSGSVTSLASPQTSLGHHLHHQESERRRGGQSSWLSGGPGSPGCLTTLNSTRKLRDSQN